MFKVIGAVVVYGLAMYGLLETIEWMDERLGKKPASRRPVDDAGPVREGDKHGGAATPGGAGAPSA